MTIQVGRRVVQIGERLHTPLANLSVSMTSLIYALQANDEMLIQHLRPGDTHRAQSDCASILVWLPAYGPFQDAIIGRTIGPIGIDVRSASIVPSSAEKETKLPSVIDALAVPHFLQHFESCRDWLTANGHGDAKLWPMPLSFARVVRNAAGHGGCLEIRNPNAPPVVWGSLSYSPADDGKKVIGVDLFLPDLVALMIEADDELTSLGAPR